MVPLDVFAELLRPEAPIALGSVTVFAARVPVPETTVNEDGDLAPWHDDVRSPGQPLAVKAESEACFVEVTANEEFWRCIATLDAGHHPASSSLADNVSHAQAASSPNDC